MRDIADDINVNNNVEGAYPDLEAKLHQSASLG